MTTDSESLVTVLTTGNEGTIAVARSILEGAETPISRRAERHMIWAYKCSTSRQDSWSFRCTPKTQLRQGTSLLIWSKNNWLNLSSFPSRNRDFHHQLREGRRGTLRRFEWVPKS
jgi:hypothetical protein